MYLNKGHMKIHFKIYFFYLLLLLSYTGVSQSCDFHFTSPNTGNNMIVLLHDEALNNNLLNVGDSIGAFINVDDNWVCVGASFWDGDQQVLAIWGDDSVTEIQDGLLANQEILLKAKSEGQIFTINYNPILEYVVNDVQTINTVLEFELFCSNNISGCTDSDYIEFNPFATVEDGSCYYSANYFSSPDSSVIFNTDNNMSIVFSSGILIDYQGAIIQAFVNGVQVSEAVLIDSIGMAGISVVGTDSFCDCDLANNGDLISFAIFDPLTYSVLNFTSSNEILYQANGFVGVDSISFNVHQAISYQLSSGWNMVGYTGSVETSVNSAMPLNFENDFFLIKDVNGNFWNSLVDMLGTLIPGKGYMMYVYPEVNPPNLNFSEVYNSNIEFQLTLGWNMVAFTGATEKDIEEAMPESFQDDFFLIKDVNGNFWNSLVDMLHVFIPGKAYMMYVYLESDPIPLLNFTD